MEGGILKKHPCDFRGIKSSHKNPANWMTLEKAQNRISTLGSAFRLGFSITLPTKLFFIDLDHCIINGIWSDLAIEMFNLFPNCFVEISQSGTGIHIMGRYTGDVPPHINKPSGVALELYTTDRFVMFGGINPIGDWNIDATESFHSVVIKYCSKEAIEHIATPTEADDAPKYTDEQVLTRALAFKSKSSKAIFGDRATFAELYYENEEVLSRSYPPIGAGEPYDRSSADLAIANMLAHHTEGNKEQIIKLMMGSKLKRDKWEVGTYLSDTVDKAISDRQVLQSSKQGQSNKLHDESQPLVEGLPDEYQGCYWVYDLDKVYSIPHSRALSEKGFNVAYNDLSKTKAPIASFIKAARSAGHTVDSLGFRPNLPHGEIIERDGDTFINSYRPVKINMKPGNIEPFLNLLRINYPVERDQRIILSYMAALVQNPGVKAMWCPVLQGNQGCGKSFLMDFAAHAVGEKYTYRARGSDFESQFNGNFFAKLVLLIEDPILKTGKLEERLKQLVTQKLLAFESKRVDAKMGDHYANLIVTLNDFDNFKKQEGSRRYAVLKSAIQSDEDQEKAGLNDAYFFGLANWRDTEGYQTVSYYLHNHIPDPEFDFSKSCCTAPHTSTTEEAIEDCKSPAELLIQEAIDSERIGFRAGIISGTQLSNLFNEQGRRGIVLHNNQRSRVLRSLGYILHPMLVKGRASRKLSHDGNQPALYVKIDHPTINISDKETIMRAYEDAQK
jgi:hypothetical protein